MTAPSRAGRPDRRQRARRIAVAAVALLLAAALGLGALASLAPPASAQAGATTTTDPVDDRRLGDIIPEPNTGRAPETPGDPGGWLQVSLFFLICAAVIAIVLVVWRQSRRARERRAEAGLDPVEVAKRRGEGVRQPR